MYLTTPEASQAELRLALVREQAPHSAFESVNSAAFADVNEHENNNSNAILEAPKVINLKPCGSECFLC